MYVKVAAEVRDYNAESRSAFDDIGRVFHAKLVGDNAGQGLRRLMARACVLHEL